MDPQLPPQGLLNQVEPENKLQANKKRIVKLLTLAGLFIVLVVIATAYFSQKNAAIARYRASAIPVVDEAATLLTGGFKVLSRENHDECSRKSLDFFPGAYSCNYLETVMLDSGIQDGLTAAGIINNVAQVHGWHPQTPYLSYESFIKSYDRPDEKRLGLPPLLSELSYDIGGTPTDSKAYYGVDHIEVVCNIEFERKGTIKLKVSCNRLYYSTGTNDHQSWSHP